MSQTIELSQIGEKLRECPFCGGSDLELKDYTETVYGFGITKYGARPAELTWIALLPPRSELHQINGFKREMMRRKQRQSASF